MFYFGIFLRAQKKSPDQIPIIQLPEKIIYCLFSLGSLTERCVVDG